MYLAKMVEDGEKKFTKPFATIGEARAEGRRVWMTNRFDVIEIVDWGLEQGVFEAIRYVPMNVQHW